MASFPPFFLSVSGIGDGLYKSKVRVPESPGRTFTSQGIGREKQVPPTRSCSLRVRILRRCLSSWHYITTYAKPVWECQKEPHLGHFQGVTFHSSQLSKLLQVSVP